MRSASVRSDLKSGMKTGQAKNYKLFKLYGKTNKTNRYTLQTIRKNSDGEVRLSPERIVNPTISNIINETKQGAIFSTNDKDRPLSQDKERATQRKRSSIKVLPKNMGGKSGKTGLMLSENEEEAKALRKSPSPFRISSEDEEENIQNVEGPGKNVQLLPGIKNHFESSR